ERIGAWPTTREPTFDDMKVRPADRDGVDPAEHLVSPGLGRWQLADLKLPDTGQDQGLHGSRDSGLGLRRDSCGHERSFISARLQSSLGPHPYALPKGEGTSCPPRIRE